MAGIRRNSKTQTTRLQEQDPNRVVWTNCPECGDIWTIKAIITVPGKCPFCGSKVKAQKLVF